MDWILRFGLFEIDSTTGELRKEGRLVKLQDQPFQVLLYLASRSGQVVTREELQKAVWPADTFVDFDHGVNTAIKKIRAALGDAAENPRFIETLPRKGYRFIAPVTAPAADVAPVVQPPRRGWPGWPGSMAWALPAALALMLAGGAWYALSPRHAVATAPELKLALEPVTTYPGGERSPAFSPDGRDMVFVWNGPGGDNFDLYVKRAGLEEPVRLTTHPGFDFSPAYSPDGQRLAFLRVQQGPWVDLMVVPAGGGPETRVGRGYVGETLSSGSGVAWTPDGRALVAARAPFGLVRIPLGEGGAERVIVPGGTQSPAFSPDGRFLAFVRAEGGFSNVHVVPLSPSFEPTGPARAITAFRDFAGLPTWLAGSQSLLVTSGTETTRTLWKVPLSGGAPERLPVEQVWSMAVAPDGRLVFQRRQFNTDIWSVRLKDDHSAAGPAQRFVHSTQAEIAPRYSPDGGRVVFISARSGSQQVWVANADGSKPARLTAMNAPRTGWPSWSPDGQRIVFDSTPGGPSQVFTVPAAGGEPTQLTHGDGISGVAGWSARDHAIYYYSRPVKERGQIWKMPESGGPARPVTQKGGRVPRESPDGRYYYYAKDNSGRTELWRVPVDGGEEVPVLRDVSGYLFAPVRDGVYYTPAPDGRAGFDIRYHAWLTGEDKLAVAVRDGGPPWPTLAVSPDERTLLYVRLDQTESDLLSVRLPP